MLEEVQGRCYMLMIIDETEVRINSMLELWRGALK